MKIVSLNINSFGGDGESFEEMKKNLARKDYGGNLTKECKKDALSRWDCAISGRLIYKSILKEIEEVDADIVLFQEYYINSDVAEQFEAEMQSRKYTYYSNDETEKLTPTPLHTVAFCRDDKNFKEMKENQFEIDGKIYGYKDLIIFDGRIFMFEYKDFVIIDAHMPLNPKDDKRYSEKNGKMKERAENVEQQWERIKKYLKDKKDEKVIFIGDLNVDQRGTHQYESFVPLFKSDVDMRDLWLEQDGKDNAITYKNKEETKTRLDYALVTPGILEGYKYTMSMIPELDEEFEKDWHISDHRMLVVDIEEDEMRENDYKATERRILCSALERMFPDGGETYTFEEVKRLFEEEGVCPKNFEDALSTCVEEGWIIDCGNGNYTR